MPRPRPTRIAMPIGDPNGIGPEIALRTVDAYLGHADVEITLFGPERVLERTARSLSLGFSLAATPLVATQPIPDAAAIPGQVNPEAGAATIDAASRAIQAAHRGEFDA